MKPSKKLASHNNPSGKTDRKVTKRVLFLILLLFTLMLYITSEEVQRFILSLIFPSANRFTHSRKTILEMTGAHISLSLLATALSTITGVLIGIAVTRQEGKSFQQLVLRLNAFIQTFPPSAVIILAFPILGFGWEPALLALFLYSLFPILGNTVVGLQSVSLDVKDSASGMGMTPFQRLWIAELPQASPMILTGIRHSYILNLGTAAIAAVIGGGGLGTIIISGLTLRNSALVLSGTIVISLLAFIGEQLFHLLSGSVRT
ncbi:MAG: ABC transporter permease [Spirochaetota bacterium]